MAAPIMSNDSIPLPEEVEHLSVPVIGAQRPAMMEDDGLRVLGAPVLVEYRHPILRGNCAHLSLLSSGAQAPTSGIRDRLPKPQPLCDQFRASPIVQPIQDTHVLWVGGPVDAGGAGSALGVCPLASWSHLIDECRQGCGSAA